MSVETATYQNRDTDASSRRMGRDAVLNGLLFVSTFLFLVSLALLAVSETGGTNSYAALASSFLEGRLDVQNCFDVDCAIGPDGRRWVIFPPFPALVAMPFVSLFGVYFTGFHLLGAWIGAVAGLLWHRNFVALGLAPRVALWMAVAIILASPAIFTIMRSDRIWFFSQAVSFFLVTAAIHEALHRKRAFLIGAYIAMAFLTRQMSIFYAPLMLVMIMDPTRPVVRIDGEVLKKTMLIAIPIVAAIGAYFLYNWVRFGGILENGYELIYRPEAIGNENPVLNNRHNSGSGLFSTDYVFFNFVYLFLQGFHFEFSGNVALTPVAMDRFGSSLLAASPYVLVALFAPIRREMVIGWMTIALMVVIMLFYHSNGFSQINVQRYTLDWLPILFMIIAKGLTPGRFDMVRLLILYSIGLNMAAFALTTLFA